jgi:hypothetical protein
MIITRRFWCCNARATRAVHVDVRSPEGITKAQAWAKAETFAARKLGDKGVWTMSVPKHGAAQFTIGRRR